MHLVEISKEIKKRVAPLTFAPPVAFVYNPLEYAWEPYVRYLEKFAKKDKEVLLVGMNPGPFGMAQTGVPFGDVGMVRDWLKISGFVGKPAREHPKRPVTGFDCHRSEVSGTRLWGWVEKRFGKAEHFFSRFFVANYCPLVFIEESGRNRTPNKLKPDERRALFSVCDWGLEETVKALNPKFVLGIGAFVESRCKEVFKDRDITVGRVLHPSPASPKANKGWAKQVEAELSGFGIALP